MLMHRYVMPDAVKERVMRRQGKLFSHDTIEAARAALVVVDMQNFFCGEGFPLEALLGDLRVRKATYSAFMPGSSDIEAQLKSRGIDTVLITGTATNVCCESTARDAMLLDYRVMMISDANATWTDEEHAATLNTFMMFFGDVMSTDEAVARLV